MTRTWMQWVQSWFVFTYSEFICHLRDTSIPIRKRQDYFYNHVHLYSDALQQNKDDLHYASTILCE